MKSITQNNKSIGTIFAILATLIWSANFVIARGLSSQVPPITLAFYRWFTALIAISPFAVKSAWQNRTIIKENILYLTLAGFFGVTLFNTLIYIAGQSTTSFNLSLIAVSSPIFIVAFAILFFKERIKIIKGLGIFIVILGVFLLLTKGNISTLSTLKFAHGDLWMLLAAIVFAVYSMLVRIKPKLIETRIFLFSTFLIGVILLIPAYLWECSNGQYIASINSKTMYAILYLGIFASLIAFYLWNEAIHKIGSSKSALIYYLIPVFSGFLAYLFLGEKIVSGQFISMLVILIGLVIYNRF